MGYFLQALIGNQETLQAHASQFRRAHVVPLAQGIAMIPLTNDLHGELGSGGEAQGFEKLSPAVEQWAQRISSATPIAYIEAEFFGGVGVGS
jgi:hypothetical protein